MWISTETPGERNSHLLSFFQQDYANFELIFAVQQSSDPAAKLVQSLISEYRHVRSRLLITGRAPYPNAKVYSLDAMTSAASHDLLVLSDSDIRVEGTFLSRIAAEFASDRYDLATCPYRAQHGGTIWSRLEALGINTEFWAGVLVAKLTEGVRFAVGPTIIARRRVLDAIPWHTLSRYLAEDFVLGHRAAEENFRVDLSGCIVDHHLAGEPMRNNLLHRLRWARSTRRSRPWGYLGQIFTYPLPLALLLVLIAHSLWPVLIATLLLRSFAAEAVSDWVLGKQIGPSYWLLLPLQDVLGFGCRLVGFTGNSVHWRGRDFRVRLDGTFEPIP